MGNFLDGRNYQSARCHKVDKMLVKIPELEYQEEYINFVEQVDKSKVTVQKSLDETRKLFDSLMQEYFG